jgi:formate dehydrogenase major subunit
MSSPPSVVTRPDFRPRQREKRPPCAGGCPNDADIRGWVGILAQRHRLGLSHEAACTAAWLRLVERNPLPASLGRICPHPCESACNRRHLEGAVQVHALEQFLGDWALLHELQLPPPLPNPAPARIGVIGAGPGGLSAAYQLARRGHLVTVYDRHERPGGMLRYAIPEYRLPGSVVDAEVRRILALGIRFCGGCVVGVDITLEELRDRHDALFLGIGAQRARRLQIEGVGKADVRPGILYLAAVKAGAAAFCGRRVVVVGGGNTAVDAARTARRAGSDVTVLYRRGPAEMPAFADEVAAMLREGVRLETLAAPIHIEKQDGRVLAVVVQRMQLAAPDATGRRQPLAVPGVTLRIACDAVIAAVAQEVDWRGLDGAGLHAGVNHNGGGGVWAGGDVLGPGTAIRAIAEGRKAAEAIHSHFAEAAVTAEDAGAAVTEDAGAAVTAGEATASAIADEQVVDLDAPEPRSPFSTAAGTYEKEATPALWAADAYGARAILEESARCLSCGLCAGCERCAMYCSAGSFRAVHEPAPGRYYEFDVARCQACGKCVDVCPTGYLEFALTGAPRSRTAGGSNRSIR